MGFEWINLNKLHGSIVWLHFKLTKDNDKKLLNVAEFIHEISQRGLCNLEWLEIMKFVNANHLTFIFNVQHTFERANTYSEWHIFMHLEIEIKSRIRVAGLNLQWKKIVSIKILTSLDPFVVW